MLILHLDKTREFKVGEVVHLKIVSIYMQAPGKWRLAADDVTPLPGAEIGYACHGCGIVMEANPDGSLPEDWVERTFERGSYFLCGEDCQQLQLCRVCGCTVASPCETDAGPCHWVEKDLCSACVGQRDTE
jgi:hypothetical protein